MPKAAGIVSLVFGILALTVFSVSSLGIMGNMLGFVLILLVDIILAIVALIVGIVGVATAKGNYSRAPSIVGIVFGAIVLSFAFLFLMTAGY